MKRSVRNPRKYQRWTTRVIVVSLLAVLVLPLIPYAVHYSKADIGAGAVPNPGADLWRDVRQRDTRVTGQTQVKGVETGVLINTAGENWRLFRMQALVPYGAVALLGVLALIVIFYLLKGRLRIPGGRSDERVLRFVLSERIVHWFTVGIFWLLALTGLVLLYGRFVLIPLLGAEGFSATASAAKEAHNLFGPLFLFAIVILFITFIKDNLPAKGDLTWLARAGGLFGGHASAGRFNAGEKIWFWIASVFGLALALSGLILDFAILGQGRELMALSHVIHGVSAILVIAVSFGHIYLGTLGMEGSIESMTTGYVDANWAKAHHDRWYEQTHQGKAAEHPTGGVSAPGVSQAPRDD